MSYPARAEGLVNIINPGILWFRRKIQFIFFLIGKKNCGVVDYNKCTGFGDGLVVQEPISVSLIISALLSTPTTRFSLSLSLSLSLNHSSNHTFFLFTLYFSTRLVIYWLSFVENEKSTSSFILYALWTCLPHILHVVLRSMRSSGTWEEREREKERSRERVGDKGNREKEIMCGYGGKKKSKNVERKRRIKKKQYIQKKGKRKAIKDKRLFEWKRKRR